MDGHSLLTSLFCDVKILPRALRKVSSSVDTTLDIEPAELPSIMPSFQAKSFNTPVGRPSKRRAMIFFELGALPKFNIDTKTVKMMVWKMDLLLNM